MSLTNSKTIKILKVVLYGKTLVNARYLYFVLKANVESLCMQKLFRDLQLKYKLQITKGTRPKSKPYFKAINDKKN